MEENLPPIEHKTLRRMIRVLLNRSRGLALAGGGARSLSHIGCLEIFEKENIEFDAVVGSSMGAVIGALYCMGKSSIEIKKMIDEFIPNSQAILDKNIPTISFFKGKKINVLLDEVFQDIRFEELDIPFYAIATDLVSGKMIIFDKGFLDLALRCSTSLPGIFPPIRFGEFILVDGSVIANLPGHILKEKGYHKILGIDVTPIIDKISFGNELFSKRGVKGIYEYFSLPPILSIISRSITIQGRELTQYHTQFFDYVLHIDVSKFHLFDFNKKDEIIKIGNSTTLSKIGEIKQIMFDL